MCLLAVSLVLNSGEVFADITKVNPEKDQPRVLVWGDSLSAAYGIEVKDGWVALLKARYADQLSVVNGSISGETTQSGLTRLPKALETHKPQLLLLELGANDGLRGIKTEVMQQNLQQMIKLAQAQNVQVVLIGIRIPLNYGVTYTQKFEQVYRDLATQNHLPLLPFLLEGVALDFELMQEDGLHPTAQAQPKILDHVLSVLAPVLAELIKSEDLPQRLTDAVAVTQ